MSLTSESCAQISVSVFHLGHFTLWLALASVYEPLSLVSKSKDEESHIFFKVLWYYLPQELSSYLLGTEVGVGVYVFKPWLLKGITSSIRRFSLSFFSSSRTMWHLFFKNSLKKEIYKALVSIYRMFSWSQVVFWYCFWVTVTLSSCLWNFLLEDKWEDKSLGSMLPGFRVPDVQDIVRILCTHIQWSLECGMEWDENEF